MNGLRLKQLRLLGENKAVKAAMMQGGPAGFQIIVTSNNDQTFSLLNDRGGVRIFPKVETAFRLLRDCGISHFTVELADWMADSPKMASGH